MRKKVKLFCSIALLFLLVSCLAFGVYASPVVSRYVVSGSVEYDSSLYDKTNVYARITNATVRGGTVTSTNNEMLSDIYINDNNPDQDEQKATWQNLKLKFNDNAEDIEISFKVTNVNQAAALSFGSEREVYQLSENLTCTVSAVDSLGYDCPDITKVNVPSKNGYITVTMVFSVGNKYAGVKIPSFTIPFTLFCEG